MAEINRRLVEAWRSAKAEQVKWKEVADALAERINERLADDELGMVDGQVVVTNKHKIVHRIDVKALREKEPEIAERFTVEKDERAGLRDTGVVLPPEEGES